ncbi:MAG: TetR family transcriptional regulator [Actinomycetota bacterium]|nr:TetR family transcriptional regulator [Actinomycetota bacterium]
MSERRTRADAVSNRARIVDVARELLTTTSDLAMNAVAKAAGVGQGTLYRNFPTREALLAEVYRADVDRLVASAPELLEEHDAVTALRTWLDNVADYAQVKRGVLAALESASGHDLAGRAGPPGRRPDPMAGQTDSAAGHADSAAGHADSAGVHTDLVAGHSEPAGGHTGPIGEAIDRLLAAGRDEGTLRADVDAGDVLLLLGFLSRPEAAGRARHVLDLILDGIRVR